jgi:subtilase family serine protease
LHVEPLESRDLPAVNLIARPNYTVKPADSSASPSQFAPAQILHAYGFDKLPYNGAGQTIAIVDAFDHPNVLGDLQTFDRRFKLPDPPSFVKHKMGAPAVNGAWAGEIALDVEWAHAVAPRANILLVEANSDSGQDLLDAVAYAAAQPGVVAVSMSWDVGEFSSEGLYDSSFTTPAGHIGGSGLPGGITFVAASGDTGAGAQWPASSPNVLAVGGTILKTTANGTYVGEPAWSASAGGKSLYEKEPSWQSGAQSSGMRGAPDVAYNASTTSGFLVYDSQPDSVGDSGWLVFGGTSAGAPQWAALVALADQGRAQLRKPLGSLGNVQSILYMLPSGDFHDITTGTNGYHATPGYDFVTGLGSPRADLLVLALINAPSTAPSTLRPRNGSGGPRLGHASVLAREDNGLGSAIADVPPLVPRQGPAPTNLKAPMPAPPSSGLEPQLSAVNERPPGAGSRRSAGHEEQGDDWLGASSEA